MAQQHEWTSANNLIEGKHVVCIPIVKEERPFQLTININGSAKSFDDIDWLAVGGYVATTSHYLDVKSFVPGWNIFHEFTTEIPEWVQSLPKGDIQSFLQGFELTSHLSENAQSYIVKSKTIALGIQRLYAKLKQYATIHIVDEVVYLTKKNNNVLHLIDEDYMYLPILTIDESQTQDTIYSLDVGNDNCYTVNNIVMKVDLL